MPERSNLFESDWSNQWLTQKRVRSNAHQVFAIERGLLSE
jgi:hypothetical protein